VIDDFGTGYSSLGYLTHFPVNAIKFDRSLIMRVGTDTRAAAIVSGVVAIGNALGLRVVAEGIELPDQLAAVQRLGCHSIQGFLFSRPVDPDRVMVLLEQQIRSGRIEPAAA
jgi:EAL domain-containing protein (putative c-di-GMP-specific phosphodiesterase class I)